MYVSNHFRFYEVEVADEETQSFVLVTYGTNQYSAENHKLQYDWSCTCNQWQQNNKTKGGYCKHIRRVQNAPPEANGRNLWVANDEKPFISGDQETLSRLVIYAKRFLVKGNKVPVYAIENRDLFLEKLLTDFLASIAYYVPPVLIKAIDIDQKITGFGELKPFLYGQWFLYQLLSVDNDNITDEQLIEQSKAQNALNQAGFDPQGYYTLASVPEVEHKCPLCQTPMTLVPSNNPICGGYKCTATVCNASVNNPKNIDYVYKKRKNAEKRNLSRLRIKE